MGESCDLVASHPAVVDSAGDLVAPLSVVLDFLPAVLELARDLLDSLPAVLDFGG